LANWSYYCTCNINLFMSKTYDKKYCEDFQNGLTFEKIESIWKSYREAGNSIEGRIIKLVKVYNI
jgi:hypothetical protein